MHTQRKTVLLCGFISIIAAGLFVAAPHTASAAMSDGALIKTAASPDVYIVKIYGGKRFKRLILNPDIFNQYQHLKWENIELVPQATLDSFVTSALVRASGDMNVWKLYPQGDTGSKRKITDPQMFISLSCDWDAIYEINTFERDSYYLTENALPGICVGVSGTTTEPSSQPVTGTSDPYFVGEYWNFPIGTGVPPLFPTILPQYVRNDVDVDFNWGYASPAPNINADKFLVRWTKKEFLPTGNYVFTVTSDDGVRLWVDSTLLVNRWFDHNTYTYAAGLISDGRTYHIRMEYYENQYQAVAKLVILKK